MRIRLLSTSGLLGYGFPEASLEGVGARAAHDARRRRARRGIRCLRGQAGKCDEEFAHGDEARSSASSCARRRQAAGGGRRRQVRRERGLRPQLQAVAGISARDRPRRARCVFTWGARFGAGQGLGAAATARRSRQRRWGSEKPTERTQQKIVPPRRASSAVMGADPPDHLEEGAEGGACRTLQRYLRHGPACATRGGGLPGWVRGRGTSMQRRTGRVAERSRLPAHDGRSPRCRARSDESDPPLCSTVLRHQSQPARERDPVLSHRARRSSSILRPAERGRERACGARQRHDMDTAALHGQAGRRGARGALASTITICGTGGDKVGMIDELVLSVRENVHVEAEASA